MKGFGISNKRVIEQIRVSLFFLIVCFCFMAFSLFYYIVYIDNIFLGFLVALVGLSVMYHNDYNYYMLKYIILNNKELIRAKDNLENNGYDMIIKKRRR